MQRVKAKAFSHHFYILSIPATIEPKAKQHNTCITMPLGYSSIHRPQSVLRSVSFGVVEPYIETSSLPLSKSTSSGNLVQTAATFPGRNRRLINRSHSTDEAYLCSRLAADILSDTTNTDGISTDRSATPFVSATPILPSSLRAFTSSATQECRDAATTDEMFTSDHEETAAAAAAAAAQENDEDGIFRSAATTTSSSGNELSFIHRLEPTIGEASDEEDQSEEDVDEEEYVYNFDFRRGCEVSQRDDSPSRQGSSPSLLCLKRANPIYDSPAGDSDSETGIATDNDNDQSWPSSEFESPAKRSRKHMTVEQDHHIDEANIEAPAATTTILATPALYYRPEDICTSSTPPNNVGTPTNDDQLMTAQSLEADAVDGYNISAIFASAE